MRNNFLDTKPSLEVIVDNKTMQRSLHAKKSFLKNDIICDFHWEEIVEYPTYLTIQLSEKKHVKLLPNELECINHSCEPNVFFDVVAKKLIALKNIQLNDEITFFYPSTEWEMNQPFKCRCNCEKCLGEIKGANYLSEDQKLRYLFSPFILKKLSNNHL